MAAQPIGSRRPVAAIILGVLAAVAGVLGVIDVLRYLGILPVAEVFGVEFFGTNWVAALTSGIVAVLWCWAARQLWSLHPQGWLFVVVIAGLNLIFLLVAILGGTSFQAVALHVIVYAIALILALLPGTRAAFGQT